MEKAETAMREVRVAPAAAMDAAKVAAASQGAAKMAQAAMGVAAKELTRESQEWTVPCQGSLA